MNKDKVYMDACCFIDMVQVELGKDNPAIGEARKNDAWFLRKLSDAARDKEIQIYTSALTIAECLHAGDGVINEDVKNLYHKYLTSGQIVLPISADPFVVFGREIYIGKIIYYWLVRMPFM